MTRWVDWSWDTSWVVASFSVSGKPGRKNGESGGCVFQDGVWSREEGRAHWLYQEHRDTELLDKELKDWVEVRYKQVNMGRTVSMEMVMKARAVFSKATSEKGGCPRTGSGVWTCKILNQAGHSLGRVMGCYLLCALVSSSSSPFILEKYIFNMSYFFTWIVVKQMFALKLFMKLYRYFLCTCLYVCILELKDEKTKKCPVESLATSACHALSTQVLLPIHTARPPAFHSACRPHVSHRFLQDWKARWPEAQRWPFCH